MPRPSKKAREPILNAMMAKRVASTSEIMSIAGFSRTLTYTTLAKLEADELVTRFEKGQGPRAVWIYTGGNAKVETVDPETVVDPISFPWVMGDHPIFQWWFFNMNSGKIEPSYE